MPRMEARERLRLWIDRSKLNQRMAAKILGVHYTFVNQMVQGRRTPSLATAVMIERHTGIPPGAWVPTDEGKVAPAVAGESRKRRSA